MTRKKTRGLRPDEQELWDKVRQSATPMHASKRLVLKAAIESKTPQIPKIEIPNFRAGQTATAIPKPYDLAPSIGEALAANPIQMDRKKHQKMARGKIVPDGRIDLHGMTIAQAHPALIRYIAEAYDVQKRLVLVITGKGKIKPDTGPIPTRIGVLKHQVPMWLNQAPLTGMVLQITEAHAKHGGGGAYYVYLRRRR